MLPFKTGDFVFKTPACFAILFGLGIVSHKVIFFYQRSSFALLTTNYELRNMPIAKLFISHTGYNPVLAGQN